MLTMLLGAAIASATVAPVSASAIRIIPPASTIYASGAGPCFTGRFGAGGGRKEPSVRSITGVGALGGGSGARLDSWGLARHPVTLSTAIIANASAFMQHLA